MIPQKLNPYLSDATVSLTFENSTLVPNATTLGDPLKNEEILLPWRETRSEGVELHISLGTPAFVDTVVLTLGEKTALTSAVLKGAGGKVLTSRSAEPGKALTASPLELSAGAITDALSVVLAGNFSDISISSVELYGFIGEDSPVFPTPREEALTGERIPVERFTAYTADSKDAARAGELLAERFGEITGQAISHAENGGEITLVTDPSIVADGYELSVSTEGTVIRASNLRGLVMGVECFLKLTDRSGVSAGRISDAPFCALRGVHLFLPSENNLEFTRRLIKYLVSPMGYNLVIFEVATGMFYDSHPEISEAALAAIKKGKAGVWPPFPHGGVAEGTTLPKSEIRALVAYIRSFGIEVVPEVQSLGHIPYITHAHPEIAEVDPSEDSAIDTRAEDARPDKFYPHCYCPSNDRSYEILFDLLDEVIEVFEPREYVHMGHDEVYYMGLCPRCRERSHAELYASDVNRIHAHLKEKGLKMMIWSDMLQPVTKYRTPAAVDMIPKDVLCLDFIWYFHLGKDIEDNLLSKGFKVGVGNLYSSHFPRYESRIRKSGMVGGQISTWVSTNETRLQEEGKLYDLYMTAEMLWAESYTHFCRLAYDRCISQRIPKLREDLRGIRYPSLAENTVSETLLENALTLPPVTPPTETSLRFGKCYDSIVITHTMLRRLTRLPWASAEVVAHYVITYSDGTEEKIPVTVGGNVAHWERRQNEPLLPQLYRHNGYTATYATDGETYRTEDGTPVTLYRYEHLLRRGVTPVSLTLVEDPAFDARICLYRVEGFTAR